MKRIIAYVNTTRILWVIEELQAKDINEIMVSEFFKPDSQISRLEFFCAEELIEELRCLIHRIGTCGKSADHLFLVKEIEGNSKSIFPFV